MESAVIEKVIAQAASEAAAGGVSGGLLGIGTHTDLSARPKAEVELSGTKAAVTIDLTMDYPVSVRQATARVRDHVIRRVNELTGIHVTRVDINVRALHIVTEPRWMRLR